jgi:hypothetical protein
MIIIGKIPLTDPKSQRGGRGIALLFLDLGVRRVWLVSTTARPLYLWESSGTHCIMIIKPILVIKTEFCT